MAYASIIALGKTAIATRGELHVPDVGLWSAWAEVDSETDLFERTVTLRVGDLVLTGTVISGSVYQGRGAYRLVGGFGGWRRTIPAAALRGPLGRLATIIEDAGRLVGEKVRVEADRVVGPYVRHAGPASRVLALAPSWYVDDDGTTVIGPRPTAAAKPRVLNLDPASRIVDVYEDELVEPGATMSVAGLGDVTVRAAVHHFGGGSRLHV